MLIPIISLLSIILAIAIGFWKNINVGLIAIVFAFILGVYVGGIDEKVIISYWPIKLFITTFAQYNDQIDNINLNVRFQWRFAPVSDLFIIYTGNSYTGDFTNKNRGLAIKLSYWFN